MAKHSQTLRLLSEGDSMRENDCSGLFQKKLEGIMFLEYRVQRDLDANQTKSLLSTKDELLEKLSELECVRLDEKEACRALLNHYTYAWSVAEAAGLTVMSEVAEIGIIEMSVRLGFRLDKTGKASRWNQARNGSDGGRDNRLRVF
jgi:hypothetical protein